MCLLYNISANIQQQNFYVSLPLKNILSNIAILHTRADDANGATGLSKISHYAVPFDTHIDKTNTNDTSQNCDLTFGPNAQNASTSGCRKKTNRNILNAILINTNSVKSITNTTKLKITIQSNNPDIRFQEETKIDENYPTYSFLPPN